MLKIHRIKYPPQKKSININEKGLELKTKIVTQSEAQQE